MGRHPAKNMESQLMTGKVFRNADVIKWSACFASNQFKTNLNRLSGFCNFNFNSNLIALNVLFETFAKGMVGLPLLQQPGNMSTMTTQNTLRYFCHKRMREMQ